MAEPQSRFAALPPRQKVSAIIFLLIAIFVIWEIIGMLRGGRSEGTTIAPSQPAIAATAPTPKPALTKTPLPSAPPHAVSAGTPPAHLTPQQSHPIVENAPPSSIVLEQQEQVQNKYVSALNELQMLKIQKEIAETSQAIVAAKLATATAEKSITDLLSENETTTNISKGPGASPTSTNLAPPLPPPMQGSYSVQSVTMEQDQWHAVVKYHTKLYDVSVGDMLPPDGSLVKTIDPRGITLENAGIEQRIPLTVTDNMPGSSSEKGGSSENSPSEAPSAPPGS